MKEILFLNPAFKEVIWGGKKLRTMYGYDIPSDSTGECWMVSAHKSGECTIKDGLYKDMKLSEVWDNHRELFGNINSDVFPLLVKIIDANKDLSIQVHPNDEYARINEDGALGKTECWYVLDCDETSNIVIGHNAKDKQELKDMIYNKKWNELIKVEPIKKGDFFQITPGKVHAIKAGTVILEIQQSSDITYRLYDYDRLSNGKLRELHLDKSIDVIKCPDEEEKVIKVCNSYEGYDEERLISCDFYEVTKINMHGKAKFIQDKAFKIVNIISGSGKINDTDIKSGDNFILPYEFGEFELNGTMELVVSNV